VVTEMRGLGRVLDTVAVAGLRLAYVCHRGPEEGILISPRFLRRKIRFL
jgi:hypothetical protein